MKGKCDKTLSVWTDTFRVPEFEDLREDLHTDVCVVGAGIAGITAAYMLACEGKKVVVLDDGKIGAGETGNTTAHITAVIDDRFSWIEQVHGLNNSLIAAQSQRAAIEEIERIIDEESIKCDFKRVDGYLFFKSEDSLFMEEFKAARRVGMKVEITGAPIKSFSHFKTLKFPDQAQFHVLKYISSLANAIKAGNGKIFNGTSVNNIIDGEKEVILKTVKGFTVKAADAIIATNSPVSDIKSVHVKQTAYRTYVLGFKIKKNVIPAALYWDSEDPYHYIRIFSEKDHDVLIIGGEDHKTGHEENPEQRFKNLEDWSNRYFENIGSPVYKWSGQVMEPLDGLSLIGKDPENPNHVYVITGDSGMGMTHATFAGIIIRDLISGIENKWAEIYDPGRTITKNIGRFIKEGVDTISNYVELVTPGEVNNADEIEKGSGAILREGLEKIAVYKNENGKILKFSARCPHLKCILHWNKVEKSWDCPCHGSRFDCNGKVLNGPAISDMINF